MAENPMSEQEYTRFRTFVKRFSKLNSFLYRWSGGRLMGRVQGRPVMLVTMTGARSGKQRAIPLMYVPYQDGVIVVGSLGGAPKSPIWVKNLVAHPEIVVQVGKRKMNLRARRVDEAEKAALWPICVEHYQEYDDYQKRTDRSIPVFVCEPR